MDERTRGWMFVGGQAVLLITLVVLPTRQDWPTPTWVDLVGGVVFLSGLGLVVAAALGLGSALTPTPVPKQDERLETEGLYARVRHPIYTGVLMAVAGVTLRSGSFITLAVAAATMVFFHQKAAWEERRLLAVHPEYRDYAQRTPRFFPRLRMFSIP